MAEQVVRARQAYREAFDLLPDVDRARQRPGLIMAAIYASLLDEIAHNIAGRSFCPLGDAAATPIMAGIKRFRDEFEAGLTTPARELFPYEASANYARGGGR